MSIMIRQYPIIPEIRIALMKPVYKTGQAADVDICPSTSLGKRPSLRRPGRPLLPACEKAQVFSGGYIRRFIRDEFDFKSALNEEPAEIVAVKEIS